MASKWDSVAHLENELEKTDLSNERRRSTIGAQQANINEHNLTVRQAIRSYPWAILWSMAVSMSIIMEGYDTQLISSFFGFPAFRNQFGAYTQASHDYQVAGKWQSALGSGPTAGCVVGATLNGFLIKRFGYKPVFMIALILMNAFIFINFFGKTIQLQTVGQVLSG
jgi:SP family general alpha glucoside:H+ symporter-like MFS transporter